MRFFLPRSNWPPTDSEDEDKSIARKEEPDYPGGAKQKSLVAPLGVTIIGDDEEEVQLEMQKAMRMPR